MREAIGGTWIFGIVVVFIILFSSYLAISVNYSKAFKVKNGIINIIEKYEGHSRETQEAIEDYIRGSGYGVYANCNTRGNGFLENQSRTRKYKYCVKREDVVDTMRRSYYTVTVFFKLDLPVLGNIFTFPVSGETKTIYFAQD